MKVLLQGERFEIDTAERVSLRKLAAQIDAAAARVFKMKGRDGIRSACIVISGRSLFRYDGTWSVISNL